MMSNKPYIQKKKRSLKQFAPEIFGQAARIIGIVLLIIVVSLGVLWVQGFIIMHVAQGLSNVFGWGWELPFTHKAYILVGITFSIFQSIFGTNVKKNK